MLGCFLCDDQAAVEAVACQQSLQCAGLVTDFEEKPSAERMQQLEGVSRNATAEDPFEASMGIYMFKRDVLIRLLDRHRDAADPQPDAHFGYDVIPHALEDGLRIMAHHHPGYWRVSPS